MTVKKPINWEISAYFEVPKSAMFSFFRTFAKSIFLLKPPLEATFVGGVAATASVVDALSRPILNQYVNEKWIGSFGYWTAKLVVVLIVTKVAIFAFSFFLQHPYSFCLFSAFGFIVSSQTANLLWKKGLSCLCNEKIASSIGRWTDYLSPEDPKSDASKVATRFCL